MPRFAIVIGIDDYAVPQWRLDAAVNDAVRFAEWATSAGGVEPENLRLLLGPTKPPDTRLPYKSADSESIRRAVYEFQRGAGRDGDRLYVYFGGHGLSAPGATRGVAQEPVLVPADVKSIAINHNLLLGFSEVISVLSGVGPAEQFFFLDACRDFQLEDFLPAAGQGVGPWSPPREAGDLSRQFVLYATSPGQQAFEASARGRGIFGSSLLDALSGKRPAAAVWTSGRDRYEVRFSTLSDHVRQEVADRIAGMADRQRFVQLPEPLAMRGADAVLASFTDQQMGTVRVRVRVKPSRARPSCRLQMIYAVPGLPGGLVRSQVGPPTTSAETIDIAPGMYALQAEANGFQRYREPCEATASRTVDIRLDPTVGAQPLPTTAPLPAPGALRALSDDPHALIVVRDAERAVRASGIREVTAQDLSPGIYRVQLIAAEGGTVEQLVEVSAGSGSVIRLDAPGPRLGDEQQIMLRELDIPTVNGYVHPSEILDGFANASFASLLAFAAFAAHLPDEHFEKLRRFGVPALTGIPAGRAGLMVLIGVSGERPAPQVDRERFLDGAQVVLRDLEGRSLDVGGLHRLPGMPVAGQRSIELEPGSIIAELRLPGLAPTRYALAALPGRLTLLVAAAEDSGAIDVQQYLVPLNGAQGGYLTSDPKNIRRLELAQRLYTHGRDLSVDQSGDGGTGLQDLLDGKALDPLLGALAGYSLVRAGRPEQYREVAMGNMLNHFGGLPDSHVLAAICEPERRDEHFAAASQLGLPVFAEGFRAVHEWCSDQETGRSLWTDPEMLLPGSTWTAWVASRPALRVRDGAMQPAPIGWSVLERRRAEIERALPAVGRLRRPDQGYPYSATAFLVAPGIAMTMAVALPEDEMAGCVVDFADDDTGSTGRFEVLERVATGGAEGAARFALIRLAAATAGGERPPQPITLASRMPSPSHGRPVLVAGFPGRDPRVPQDVLDLTFGGVYGVKRVQPGQVLAVKEGAGEFTNDCLTTGGNGGSPVIDIESGLVLGFHHSGRWLDSKRAEATSLWTPSVRDLLAGLGAPYEDPP